ncbi:MULTISPECIES: GNAT family N-acetyltransferase [unclassified Isoptericola]|uniref:GNAT family N-acetyltransferase n=1 Tax=unclassified Isoptericola TaxID=2623355 RepID=UPI0027136729|nr:MULTISPECIES: GNAT family N-acetyltransferase [unclassified Isoptericola]MDO8144823.1 GNAT family N-acetyltransferase [Isoptericola sp. 178]MDO8149603.1 GNAT family N-acetyltransferase [Isoptericola sp. b515]MDO8152537.1 GNAT family N-acetyltransferase [Isoptericola sp. b408]
MACVNIAVDSPARADVRALLEEHLAEMHATSPPESVHALDPVALAGPAVTFLTARSDETGQLLGCGALSELDPGPGGHGEIKSMRTARGARGLGVATRLLGELMTLAAERGYTRVSLETGAEDFFAPARRIYTRHGFVECEPFATYVPDPNSVFMTFALPVPPPEDGR